MNCETQVAKSEVDLPPECVDAFAQLIWMRLRPYLNVGPNRSTMGLKCDFCDLPEISKAPLRLAARDVLSATVVGTMDQ